MGSLGSRPSVPSTQTVFVPTPAAPVATATTVSQATADNSAAQEQAAEQDVSEARSQSLLGRDRGRKA